MIPIEDCVMLWTKTAVTSNADLAGTCSRQDSNAVDCLGNKNQQTNVFFWFILILPTNAQTDFDRGLLKIIRVEKKNSSVFVP